MRVTSFTASLAITALTGSSFHIHPRINPHVASSKRSGTTSKPSHHTRVTVLKATTTGANNKVSTNVGTVSERLNDSRRKDDLIIKSLKEELKGAERGTYSNSKDINGVRSVPNEYVYGEQKFDEDGLPLVYEPKVIKTYWDSRPKEMAQRWTYFLGQTTPFLTRLIRYFTSNTLLQNEKIIARDLRIIIENLGPTFIKLGQALSIRPDVIGPAATEELAKLQDAVPPFPREAAYKCIEKELGRPLNEVFSEIALEPAGSASLAQVYRAVLYNGDIVAVKIQRPGLLPTVTRDLYVMKKAVEVYQNLSEKWTAQTTDYRELLQVWATGFYQELDFLNEASNQRRMAKVLADEKDIIVPRVYNEYTTRKLLITEWIDGVKLTQVDPAEIRSLTAVAQHAFLKQLLEEGFIHADPHPGNLIRPNDQTKGRLALIDYGLTASIAKTDTDVMISALLHTANKDFPRLIDDLIGLRVLPKDTDRGKVEPIMRRVIGPYVYQGGGAKNLNYQSLAKDLGKATLEIPFSIPPYFALVARALGILEGIALTGDPDYKIVLEAYPYVTRRLMLDESPLLQRALQEILYKEGNEKGLSIERLANMLTYAVGRTSSQESSSGNAESSSGTVFVDFDASPTDGTGAKLKDIVTFLLQDGAKSLRTTLLSEASTAVDLLLRQSTRNSVNRLKSLLVPPSPPLPFLPRLPAIPLPIPDALIDSLSPELTLEEQLYTKSILDLCVTVLGLDPSSNMDLTDPSTALQVLRQMAKPENNTARELTEIAGVLQPNSQEAKTLVQFGQDLGAVLFQKQQSRLSTYLQPQNSRE